MFRMIKIIFNATIIVLALVGFNAIGGQKYIETLKDGISTFIAQHSTESIKKIGDFSKMNEEFIIDNTMVIAGYKAVIAEHRASGQKMVIFDSGKKPLMEQYQITSGSINMFLKNAADKINYKGVRVQEIHATGTGTMKVYGQTVPYARFDAKVTRLPFSEISGVVACVTTSDGSEKLVLSLSEKKRYSQLIAEEFFRGVNERTTNRR